MDLAYQEDEATIMSKEQTQYATGATAADVDRLMGIVQSYAGAGTMNLTPKDQSGDTTLYGQYRITNKNPFKKYAQLSIVSSHVFIPLIKLGLGTVSGLKLEVAKGRGNDKILEQMKEWAKIITLPNKIQNIARCTVRDGTVLTSLGREKHKTDEKLNIELPENSITAIDVLPMQYMTILTEFESRTDVNTKNLIKGTPDRALLHEEKKTIEKGMVIFEREEFALFRLFNEGSFMEDILGRKTYGIYGISLLESIDRSLKDLMDLNGGFSAYMRRYGLNRLLINLPYVEELRREERWAEAKIVLEEMIASTQKLKANEDFVSSGAEVSSVMGGAVPSVRDMKESFESDVEVGLLQSPLTMGKAVGTTYGSGYLSEADRMVILESIQSIIIQTVQSDIIDQQIQVFGGDPGDILITANDLTNPVIDNQTLTDMRINGDITEAEYRVSMGYPAEKPTE